MTKKGWPPHRLSLSSRTSEASESSHQAKPQEAKEISRCARNDKGDARNDKRDARKPKGKTRKREEEGLKT